MTVVNPYLHGFVAKIANGILALISFVRHDGIGGLQGTKYLFNSVPASFCITMSTFGTKEIEKMVRYFLVPW